MKPGVNSLPLRGSHPIFRFGISTCLCITYSPRLILKLK